MERGAVQHLRLEVLQAVQQAGVQGVVVVAGRDEHQLVHELRVRHAHEEGDRGAHAVAEDVGLGHPELAEQRRGVVGHVLDAQRAVDVGGVAVRLLLDGDHPPVLGERGEQLREVDADPGERAVQQHQRAPGLGTVHLVVHLQAVHRRVATRLGLLGGGLRPARPAAGHGGECDGDPERDDRRDPGHGGSPPVSRGVRGVRPSGPQRPRPPAEPVERGRGLVVAARGRAGPAAVGGELVPVAGQGDRVAAARRRAARRRPRRSCATACRPPDSRP